VNEYKNKSIILFDGVCNLCNSSVQFVLKRDKKNKFLFASLQSDAAKNILLHKNSEKIDTKNLSTIYLIENDVIYDKSTAILKVLGKLNFPINTLYVFILVPKFIRNSIYKWVAKNRYKWFGVKESCMVPSSKYLSKFLT
jgi:predicted DCC family thiol-disulfide oxidoreductase YuxK